MKKQTILAEMHYTNGVKTYWIEIIWKKSSPQTSWKRDSNCKDIRL